MGAVVLVLVALGVIVVSVVVTGHAARADDLWPFAGRARVGSASPTPREMMGAVELGDYVHRGLEDLSVMLAQAARKRPG
jgi:cell division septation protein DedD